MRLEYKSILDVFFSNFTVLLFGIIQAFILPNIMGPEEYGYWALYILYFSYAGILIFGFNDGFYLKYGGVNYNNLDKNLFSAYNKLLLIYLSFAYFVWILVLDTLNLPIKLYYFYIFVGLEIALTNYKGYFILLNQATSRFSIYSVGNILQKLMVTSMALYMLISDKANVFFVISASIIGSIISILYYIRYSIDIFYSKTTFDYRLIYNVIDNIKSGSLLTIYGISGMLMAGFSRFFVEYKFGIIELGYYSFVFSISVLFTQMIYACSLVFFPTFRRLNVTTAKEILAKIDYGIIVLSGIILLSYYPIRFCLEIFFPKYIQAMGYLLFLFPIIICQSRMSIVYGTIYKVFRLERLMVINVFLSLLFSVSITVFLYYMINIKEVIAFGTYLGYLFWVLCSEYFYAAKENLKFKILSLDVVLSAFYLLVNFTFGFTIISFSTMFLIVLIGMYLNKNKIIEIYTNI